MITLFTIPKPFEGKIHTIQYNAISSWVKLQKQCEIILCGEVTGISECAKHFGIKHIDNIETNQYGTPFLNSAFSEVLKVATNPILCFLNSDIILLNCVVDVIKRIPFSPFLAIGKRLNVDFDQVLDLEDTAWRHNLSTLIKLKGRYANEFSIDYFFFPSNTGLVELPPFLVGRARWDNWFVYNARVNNIAVIDTTRSITAIHQNHNYNHIPNRSGHLWYGPESDHNIGLAKSEMGGVKYKANIYDATHVMTPKGIKNANSPRNLLQRVQFSCATNPNNLLRLRLIGFLFKKARKLKRRIKIMPSAPI